MVNSVVAIERCESYLKSKPKIKRALKNAEILKINFKNKRVLLKVSLNKGGPPERVLNTHPVFVKHIVELLNELGAKVYVGDSSGVYGYTQYFFYKSGIAQVCKTTKAKLVNFEATPLFGINTSFGKFYIPKILREVDFIVSVPKLKTHMLTTYSGAIKNIIGCLPGAQKSDLHIRSSTYPDFVRNVIELVKIIKPSFTIIDGIWGMEGNGPTKGRKIRSKVIITSKDLVAADVVACRIIGINPNKVLTNVLGAKANLGTNDLSKIKVAGESIESVAVKFEEPKKPLKYKILILDKIFNLIKKRVTHLQVKQELCSLCGTCLEVCPTGAIKKVGNAIKLSQRKCIGCYVCYNNCPNKAIERVNSKIFKARLNKALGR